MIHQAIEYERGVFLKLTIDEENLKRLFPILILGVVEAMKNEAIESEESEVICFNAYTKSFFEQMGVSGDLLEIVKLGMEIDDVHRLVPYAYLESLQDMKKRSLDVIRKNKRFDYPILKCFDH